MGDILYILLCRSSEVVKRARFRVLWLSAFEGSNPSSAIYPIEDGMFGSILTSIVAETQIHFQCQDWFY